MIKKAFYPRSFYNRMCIFVFIGILLHPDLLFLFLKETKLHDLIYYENPKLK